MPLIDNWHIDAIAEHLQAIADEKIRFLMINIGPGYAKSVIASVQFSAWLWTRQPMTKVMAATYAGALTIRDSIRVRDLVTSEWYQETFNPDWAVKLKNDEKTFEYQRKDPVTGCWELVKTNEDWLSNSRKGERRALSVGGKATGFRADGQIFDDLLNASDKHSQSARNTARDWAISTMSTRFNDMRKGWRVVIGQRLHEEDPYGAMLATGDYVHLCLPSEFEPERRCSTIIGWSDPRTEPGQLLFPELFTPEVLAKAKRDLGSYDYAGQHQQRPAPAEGGLFKRDWWQYYQVAPQFDLIAISVDATFKDSVDSDYVSIQVWGFIGPRSYLLDRIHEQMGFTATKQAIKAMRTKWRPSAILIEDKANGPAVIDDLKRTISGIVAIEPEGGKLARAWAAQPDVEAGNVFLPDGQAWADEVVIECASFPNAAHDDDVDALTQALNWRRKRMFSYGLFDAMKAIERKSEEIMAKGNRKPSAAVALSQVKPEELAEESKAVPTEEVGKVDMPDNVQRCLDCQSAFFQRTPVGFRCGNCGRAYGKDRAGNIILDGAAAAQPVYAGVVRK
jgi:predicted phage terminase large subunit-like protein